MREITKITFYGKDFSELTDAKYRLGDLDTLYQLDGSKPKEDAYADRLELLKKFCDSYAPDGKHEGICLRFPKNRDRFYKYVGVFRNKKFPFGGEEYDVTLEISCRFDQDKKAFFLAAMLLCLGSEELNRKLKNPELVNLSFHQVMDIFLLFMFKRQLAEAAKKGILRKYQRFENNDSRPHGTIDIARHIRENMGLKSGSIAYHYRELTANNPVNRLILAAYRRLCEKYPMLCETRIKSEESVYSTLKMLQTELGYSKTNVRNIVKENLRPVTHPYFSEYEALRKTCLRILRDENVSIFDADCDEETEPLCVDVTRLWEQFLEFRLDEALKKPEYSALTLTTQGREPDNKRGSTQGRQLFFERYDNEPYDKRYNKYSKPDLILWRKTQAQKKQTILDAKFKPDWDEFFSGTGKQNTTTIDGDINKCIRDMVVFQAERTGVIFPSENSTRDKKYHIGFYIGARDASARGFDMVGVPVPPEGGKRFEAWYGEELVKDVDRALADYLDRVLKDEGSPPR